MFKKKEKWNPRKRFYEWRFKKTGARFGAPILCEDACEFWLLAHASNLVVTRAKTDPNGLPEETMLVIAVSLTGEIVYAHGEPGVKARVIVTEGGTEVYGEWVYYKGG